MKSSDIVKDPGFEEVGEVKADSKNRITLGRKAKIGVYSYKVYRNQAGQYVLDPQVSIPAAEAWVFQNPEVKQSLQKGLADAKAGRLVKPREDFTRYTAGSD